MANKASKDYWQHQYNNVSAETALVDPIMRDWLLKHATPSTPITANTDLNKHSLEIGCHPGRYSFIMGELGYIISGIDWCSDVLALKDHITRMGISCGTFHCADFWSFTPDTLYDAVCSFGFIEHFDNWEEAFERQASWVKEGGLLIISVPNFSNGFQGWIHHHLDKENISRHHLPAMNVGNWHNLLPADKWHIEYCGFFGPFDFWVEKDDRSFWQKIALFALKKGKPMLQSILPHAHPSFAPYGGIVARRL